MLTDGKFILDGWSRRNVDVFWRSVYMRGTGTIFLQCFQFPSCNPCKISRHYLFKFVFGFILRRIIRLADNPSRGIVRLYYKFGQRYSLRPSRPLFRYLGLIHPNDENKCRTKFYQCLFKLLFNYLLFHFQLKQLETELAKIEKALTSFKMAEWRD